MDVERKVKKTDEVMALIKIITPLLIYKRRSQLIITHVEIILHK